MFVGPLTDTGCNAGTVKVSVLAGPCPHTLVALHVNVPPWSPSVSTVTDKPVAEPDIDIHVPVAVNLYPVAPATPATE